MWERRAFALAFPRGDGHCFVCVCGQSFFCKDKETSHTQNSLATTDPLSLSLSLSLCGPPAFVCSMSALFVGYRASSILSLCLSFFFLLSGRETTLPDQSSPCFAFRLHFPFASRLACLLASTLVPFPILFRSDPPFSPLISIVTTTRLQRKGEGNYFSWHSICFRLCSLFSPCLLLFISTLIGRPSSNPTERCLVLFSSSLCISLSQPSICLSFCETATDKTKAPHRFA